MSVELESLVDSTVEVNSQSRNAEHRPARINWLLRIANKITYLLIFTNLDSNLSPTLTKALPATVKSLMKN